VSVEKKLAQCKEMNDDVMLAGWKSLYNHNNSLTLDMSGTEALDCR